MSLSITVMSIISWCLYHLAEKHDLLKMFYLCYPCVSFPSIYISTQNKIIIITRVNISILI